ncbi:MAG TPA: FtsW/RodA/SpoVE family cell cycle protein [Cryomorphaceae bacterium]|nr:FtsW/RodA/SpoVE family cell cycle protein [Cryomorphaceae bacterium]
MKTFISKYLKGDRVLWMVCLFLGLWSILAVYSSISYLAYSSRSGNTFYFLFKHAIILSGGFFLMYLIHRVNYRYFSRLSQILIWVAALLLLITLMVGSEKNAAVRWLEIPIINQSFQTSDFAKIALVVYVSRLLVVKRDKLHSFKEGVLPILLPVALITVLILPANFSTAAMLFFVCFILMFIGGVKIKHLFLLVFSAVAGFALLLAVSAWIGETEDGGTLLPRMETWLSRSMQFFDGDGEAGYQAERAMMAIHSGGVFPSGPGTGDSRNYLPSSHSDMIYAFIIEEYGLIMGGVGVALLYLIFLYRSLRVGRMCKRDFGALMSIGLGLLIVIQAFINMGVSVGILPVTGQPLPLVSLGGTSIWLTCIAIGIILSVSRDELEGDRATTGNRLKTKKKHYASA